MGDSLLVRLAELKQTDPSAYESVMSKFSDAQKSSMLSDWKMVARPEQLPPADWLGPGGFAWWVICGRGWGKTRCISETILTWDRMYPMSRIALLGRTSREAYGILLSGQSGLLTLERRAQWNPSRLEVILPNKSNVAIFTSESAGDALRGFEFNLACADEWASYFEPEKILTALLPALRLKGSRLMVATTPRPVKTLEDVLVRAGALPMVDGSYMEPQPNLVLTQGSSFDNIALPPEFIRNVAEQWAGSPVSEQEIFGRYLTEIEGALWKQETLNALRVPAPKPEDISQIVISIDPSLTSKKTSAECGIIVCAADKESPKRVFVLADCSDVLSPEQYARRALDLYFSLGAAAILYETASLREVVRPLFSAALRHGETFPRLVPVEAGGQNKFGRAASIAPLFYPPNPRVFFCGHFPGLEQQMTSYTGTTRRSPDRLDALVYAIRHLSGAGGLRYGQDYGIS